MNVENDKSPSDNARSVDNAKPQLDKAAFLGTAGGEARGDLLRSFREEFPHDGEQDGHGAKSELPPLLESSQSAAKFVPKPKSIDARQVGLEWVPEKGLTGWRGLPRWSLEALAGVSAVLLIGGVGVLLFGGRGYLERGVGSNSADVIKLAANGENAGVSARLRSGRGDSKSQPAATAADVPVGEISHVPMPEPARRVSEVSTVVPVPREVAAGASSTGVADGGDLARAGEPATVPSVVKSSEQNATLPVVEAAPVIAMGEQAMPSTPVASTEITAVNLDTILGKGSLDEILQMGHRLLKDGDVVAARKMFLHAANRGVPQGALALGSTYDPKSLASLGLVSVAPDVTKALRWYRRAHVLADGGK